MGKAEELGSGRGATGSHCRDLLRGQSPQEGGLNSFNTRDMERRNRGGEAMGVRTKKRRKGETEAQKREPEGHPGEVGRAERAG